MKKLLFIFIFLPILIFAQKQQNVPNISNPFNSKVQNTATNISVPKTNTQNIVSKKPKIDIKKGSIWLDLKKKNIDNESLLREFNSWVNLSSEHTLKKTGERNEDLGFTHINYQQLYKGVPVYGGELTLHIKDGIVSYINGRILEVEDLDIQNSFTKEQALEKAKISLEATDLINTYPIETNKGTANKKIILY